MKFRFLNLWRERTRTHSSKHGIDLDHDEELEVIGALLVSTPSWAAYSVVSDAVFSNSLPLQVENN